MKKQRKETRKPTEIHQWSEILTNGKYKEIDSIKGIIDGNKEVLDKVISIRIPNRFPGRILQYNIETKDHITNLTTHQGLDFHITQHDKATKKEEIYTPYSSPWYNIYVNMLCAYHESFKKRPSLNYPEADLESWNRQLENHDFPLMNVMTNSYRSAFGYLYHYDHFRKDDEGIFRLIPPTEKEWWDMDWFGTKWDKAIFQFIDHFYKRWSVHRFTIEKELLHLFLQSYVDVTRSVSWSTGILNLKKIADVIFSVLEDPEVRADSEKFDIRKRYEPLNAE